MFSFKFLLNLLNTYSIRIIAVGYEARSMGVTRQMRGDDAKKKCPEITLCRVPTANGKADLTRYKVYFKLLRTSL